MRESDEEMWDLVAPDGRVFGRLTEEYFDFPWLHCRFEPTEAFAAIAELFAKDARLLEAGGKMDAWRAVYDRIEALRLELRPRDATKSVGKFPLLHISGEHAYFRGVRQRT